MEKATTPKHSSSPSPLATMIIGDSQAISSTFLGAVDEYDPLHPNDFEEYNKMPAEQKKAYAISAKAGNEFSGAMTEIGNSVTLKAKTKVVTILN